MTMGDTIQHVVDNGYSSHDPHMCMAFDLTCKFLAVRSPKKIYPLNPECPQKGLPSILSSVYSCPTFRQTSEWTLGNQTQERINTTCS